MLFVPTGIITLGILPGFISSTIRNNWAIVAPPNAITVVIQGVLNFWSTLTKLSPSIRCDVTSGGCCMFTVGLQVDRLKQALGSVFGTPVKLYFNWLFFCTSITRGTLFAGFSRIFLSGTLELLVDDVALPTPSLVITFWESCTLPMSSLVPYGAVSPEPGAFLLATNRPAFLSAFSPFAPLLGQHGCHSGPGLSLYQL